MLEKIQSSLLVYSIEDSSPHVTPEDYSQVHNYLALLFHLTNFSGRLLCALKMRRFFVT